MIALEYTFLKERETKQNKTKKTYKHKQKQHFDMQKKDKLSAPGNSSHGCQNGRNDHFTKKNKIML